MCNKRIFTIRHYVKLKKKTLGKDKLKRIINIYSDPFIIAIYKSIKSHHTFNKDVLFLLYFFIRKLMTQKLKKLSDLLSNSQRVTSSWDIKLSLKQPILSLLYKYSGLQLFSKSRTSVIIERHWKKTCHLQLILDWSFALFKSTLSWHIWRHHLRHVMTNNSNSRTKKILLFRGRLLIYKRFCGHTTSGYFW